MLGLHFRRAGELPPRCVFSASARCWCWGVARAAAAVSVCCCNLPHLAWGAALGGLWQSQSVLMLGWCWGKLKAMMWATDNPQKLVTPCFPRVQEVGTTSSLFIASWDWGSWEVLVPESPGGSKKRGIAGHVVSWALNNLGTSRQTLRLSSDKMKHSKLCQKWSFQKYMNLDFGLDLGSLLTLCKSCNFP